VEGILMRASPFKEKKKRLSPSEWNDKFTHFLRRNASYERVLKQLVRAGCNETVIVEFLQTECYDRQLDKPYLRSGLRELYKKREQLSQKLRVIASQIRAMNETVLGSCDLKADHFPCIGVDGRRMLVEASEYDDLPELLLCYAQTITPRRDARDLEVNGPEVAMLSVYIRLAGKQPPSRSIAVLLEAGFECTGQKFSSGEQAIAKRIERYRKEHPNVCRIIDRVISEYVSTPIQDREPVDNFLDRLYDETYDADDIDKRPPRLPQANLLPKRA
jgi:hypothetical protein